MRDLAHRYAAAVDDRDFAAVAALFTPDGVLAVPRPPRHLDPVAEHVGPEGVLEAMAPLASVPRTFHEVVGQVYDGTRGRIACVAHHVLPGDPITDLVWHLRYLDDYVQRSGVWLFARREVHVDLVERRPLETARLP
ncbi:MAG TPA: nuclear transport factor 2 family protein [Mycobacteriales bacterium]|nr:nuclear transport factor 2 family protein [Mycobacteriales bacterium]